MAERKLEIGQGLEIWLAGIDELREQDINARSMPLNMFARLTETIRRDARLESLPFCAVTDRGIEIISGHHRVRAARAAGLQELFVLVDVSGLSRDQIAAKQLAHNAIQGQDNEQLVQQIYQSIGDAEARLEAFIDSQQDLKFDVVSADDVAVPLEFKSVLLVFLPHEKDFVEHVIEELENGRYDALWAAQEEQFHPFAEVLERVRKNYDIRNVAAAIAKMAEIVAEHIGMDTPPAEGRALLDLFGTAYIPAEAAAVIEAALALMQERGDIPQNARWLGIERLAADYLAGR